MSHTQVQLARGNSAAVAAYTGPLGELVVNTDDYSLHVQDGATAGGHEVGSVAGSNYSYQQPTSGATLTAPAYLGAYVIDPTAALASLTVIAPPGANDGQVFEVSSTQAITALTVSPAAGQTVNGGGPFLLAADGGCGWRYRAANNTWYRRF
jgi:hypothetical protein